jgi:hypothetical protein
MTELNIPQTKYCRKCDTVKPLDAFYRRGKTKYRCSYCINCMKIDSHNQRKVDKQESVVESEMAVIAELAKLGIPALHGKAFSHKLADVCAHGAVCIEVKSSKLHDDGTFEFGFSHRQQKEDIRGTLIILVCRYPDRYTYHVFSAKDPKFYRADGTLKTAASWTPNRGNAGRKPIFTDAIMKAHENAWHMIEAERQRVSQELRRGQDLMEILKAA